MILSRLYRLMSVIELTNTFLTSMKTSYNFIEHEKRDPLNNQVHEKKLIPSTFDTDAQNQVPFEPFRLAKIVKKYKIKAITKSFVSKIKRNNIYARKSQFSLKSRQQTDSQRLIKLKGVDIDRRWISSVIFLGDIIMSLFIFYISVLQAFVQGFRTEQYNSPLIMSLKVVALMFEFSKIFLKVIKKQYYKGVRLDYISDILLYSAGPFDLCVYVAAIIVIIITIFEEVTKTIGIISLVIAFIKVFKTSQNVKVLEVYYINSTRRQQYWNLIKVIIFNLFFGHLIAGILIGISDLNPGHNWITHHRLQNQTWDVIYAWAVYWSSTMITTTGFGDFAAANQHEAIIIAGLEFTSSVVLVYNINLIGTIVMRMRESDQITEKKLAVFRRMNDQTPINPFLQKKIHSYIEFQNNLQELFQFHDRNQLMQEIPEQLKVEYFHEVGQMIFKNLPFFRHLRSDTMNMLANSFSTSVVYPSEYLIKYKLGKDHIFILKKGKIGLGYQKLQSSINGTIVQSLQATSQPLLLTNYFLNRTREITFDLIAMEYSLIMKIKQSELIDIIRKSDLDKQHYFTIYDKQEISFVFKNERCNFCPNEYHNKFDCPRLHFMPFKSIVVSKHLHEPQIRNKRLKRFNREYMRKEHCYYLRKQYYGPCQDLKSIKQKKMLNNKTELKIEFSSAMKEAISDQNLSKQEFLQKCESIFRKVFQQKLQQEIRQQSTTVLRLDFQMAQNYVSYFNQCNPDKLIAVQVSRKHKNSRKYKNQFEQLGFQSNQFIYRRFSTLKEIDRENSLRGKEIKRQVSLKLLV